MRSIQGSNTVVAFPGRNPSFKMAKYHTGKTSHAPQSKMSPSHHDAINHTMNLSDTLKDVDIYLTDTSG